MSHMLQTDEEKSLHKKGIVFFKTLGLS